MNVSRLSILTCGVGLLSLPAISMAQTAQKAGQTDSATPASSMTAPAPGSDSGWTSASEAASNSAAVEISKPAPAVQSATVATSPEASSAPTASTAPVAPLNLQTKEPATNRSDEPPTLFGPSPVKVGGYGALSVRYARINGNDGVLVGLEGALLLSHRLAVGLAGYGWSNEQRLPPSQSPDRDYLHFGYAGFLVRYHVYIPNSPVYLSAAALIGGGSVGLTSTWDGDLYRENTDEFFIVEPQIGVHTNFTKWMRMGLDGGYRLISGVGKFGFTNSNFSGLSLGANIGFGWF